MKQVQILGKKVSLLLVVAVVLAIGASAALVSYLSNSITANVVVSSPFELWFGPGTPTYSKTFNVVGGDTINYETHVKSNSANDLEVYRVIHVIESSHTWTGEEFESVMLSKDGETAVDVTPYLCYVHTDGDVVPFADMQTEYPSVTTLRLMIDPDGATPCDSILKYTHPAMDGIENDISITLNPAMTPGTYTMTLCHLNDLTGDCA
jgi:hypothetical protein